MSTQEVTELSNVIRNGLNALQQVQRQSVCSHPIWLSTDMGKKCEFCGLEVHF